MGSMVLVYMVTFTINIPQMLAYIYIYTIHGSYGKSFKFENLVPWKPISSQTVWGSHRNLGINLGNVNPSDGVRNQSSVHIVQKLPSLSDRMAAVSLAINRNHSGRTWQDLAWHHFKKSTHFKISQSFDPHPWEIATPPRFSPVLVRTRTFDPVDTMVDCLVLHPAEISSRFPLKIWVRSGVFLQMWQFLPFSRCIVANHCCHVHHFEPKIPNNSCVGDVLFKLLPSGRSLWEWKSHL